MIERTCKTCGCTFTTYPSQPRVYCSRKCMGANLDRSRALSERKSKDRVTVNCKVCGKPIEVLASKSDRKKYCSRSCRAKDPDIIAKTHVPKVLVACKTCGKVFYRAPSQVRENVYCSFECMKKRVTLVCDNCGKEIEKQPSQIRKLHFCDQECRSQWLSKDLENRDRLRKAATIGWKSMGTMSPNKLEQFVADQFPELLFVGDGKLWVQMKDGHYRCPDFILRGTNRVIEVYGDYWHQDDDPDDDALEYSLIGFECLVVWGSEIKRNWKHTSARIAKFCRK